LSNALEKKVLGEQGSGRTVVALGFHQAEASCDNIALSLGARVLWADSVELALRLVKTGPCDAAVVFESVPIAEGLQFVNDMQAAYTLVPVVVITDDPAAWGRAGLPDVATCICMKSPANGLRLRQSLDELAQTDQGRQDRYFSWQCDPSVPIVGHSPAIKKMLGFLRVVAESRCNPVLIVGETGTGKELAARAVHSWRCADPEKFVAVNCATLTNTLFESELFGHVKGAFTGADRDKQGLLELAEGGSIFLDEISEMPVELQAKLLRVLQERQFRRVGGGRNIAFNATVIASSNRDLLAESTGGRFRSDLYYRLAVFPIKLPPLRAPDRREDIPLLAEYFLEMSEQPRREGITAITPQAGQMLLRHDWPGNARELRNVIERAIMLETSAQITPESIVFDGQEAGAPPAAPGREATRDLSLETAEREFILRALTETGWQRTRAAALLGISRATLHAKIKRYEIADPIGQGSLPESMSG
jgi:two-component system response regulator HydG